MLSLASGIIGLLNKALDNPAVSQGFEGLLAGMTSSTPSPGSALLSGLTAKLKGREIEGADLLASTQAGTMVLTLMAALKDAGLGAADIQALLTGSGAGLSDEALKKIMISAGMADSQVQAVMADKGLMAELKDQIVKNIRAAVGTDIPGFKMDQTAKPADTPAQSDLASKGGAAAGETARAGEKLQARWPMLTRRSSWAFPRRSPRLFRNWSRPPRRMMRRWRPC